MRHVSALPGTRTQKEGRRRAAEEKGRRLRSTSALPAPRHASASMGGSSASEGSMNGGGVKMV